jgi:ADP-ribose pyrophosphatase YjhB (NUDIX family)
MRTLRLITRRAVSGVHKHFRPTIKVFLYDDEGQVFFFHHVGHVSLPGGGIEKKETACEATYRELREELSGLTVTQDEISKGLVLAHACIHKKDGPKKKRKKHIWVVGVKVAELTGLASIEADHDQDMVCTIEDAINYIKHHKATQLSVRKLYVKALRTLKKKLP